MWLQQLQFCSMSHTNIDYRQLHLNDAATAATWHSVIQNNFWTWLQVMLTATAATPHKMIHTQELHATWSKETPPSEPPHPGGVSYLLCFLIKNPEEEDPPRRICTRCFLGGPLPPGSWLGNIINRKPLRGGEVLSIKLWQQLNAATAARCTQCDWNKWLSMTAAKGDGNSCNVVQCDVHTRTWYKFFEGGPLPPGSWLGNIVNRNPTPGGRVSFDQTVTATECDCNWIWMKPNVIVQLQHRAVW